MFFVHSWYSPFRLDLDRDSYSAKVPRSSLAEVHREFATTSWKMKLMGRRKDRMIREKMVSKERKVE